MEWQGIDLSGSKKSEWVFTTYKTIKKIVFSLIFIITVGLTLGTNYLHKKQEVGSLVEQLNQLKTENTMLIQKLSNLQNNKQILPFIKSKQIEESFQLIERLPLKNGGINSIQFYLDNNFYLKIIGNLSSQSDFQALENFLREQTLFDLKVDQINLNHSNETNFIFTIKHQGI